jgi:hypothetical protein
VDQSPCTKLKQCHAEPNSREKEDLCSGYKQIYWSNEKSSNRIKWPIKNVQSSLRSAGIFSRGWQPWRTQDDTLGRVRKIWPVWFIPLITNPCDKQYNHDIYFVFLLNSSLCDSCISKTTRKTLRFVALSVILSGIGHYQRVLNDLQRARLSRSLMILLLTHHLPSEGDTQKDWERETTCWRQRGVGLGCARSRIIRPQESLVLYKSFNTLWPPLSHANWHCLHLPLSQCKCQTGSPTEKSKAAKLIVFMGTAGFHKNDL